MLISRRALALLALLLAISASFGETGSGALRLAASWFALPAAWADDDDDRGGVDDRGVPDDRGGGVADDRPAPDPVERPEPASEPRDFRDVPEFADLRTDDFAPDEVLAFALSDAQIDQLRQRGYKVIQQRALGQVARSEVRLRIPPRTRVKQALDEVRALGPGTLADLNHYYRVNEAACRGPHCAAAQLIQWPARAASCGGAPLIGVIDTAVDRQHAALAKQKIETLTTRGPDRDASGQSHGTAIASILVGALDSATPGLLPNARLLAIDAFHRAGRSEDRMDAFDFVAAIDALLARKVRIINLSFAGPPNALVEQSIAAAHKRGVVLVAAAGNDGPRAKPRYPAAYEHVVAVTAVRADLQIYRRAIRGQHIDVSAPGVDVWAADPAARGAQARAQSGTSYAAPFVTAALALLLEQAPDKNPATLKQSLLAATRDLGASGPDPVFGHGLLQTGAMCAR
jgi:hypothetical protein